jgi:hypothetical protein
MKVITIQQPYANLVINGVKNIENRNRKIILDKINVNIRRLEYQKRYNIDSNLVESGEPTSAIIGMIHINSIKKKDNLDESKWAI